MAEEKEVKPKKAAKVKEEVIIPELSGAALVLKNGLSYESATTRLQQLSGLKYEIKEYKRSKDFKIKIKSFKGLDNSGFNFSDPDEETNTYRTEEDATYGLLAHIGYTLDNEARYQMAIADKKDEYHEKIIYSTKPNQSGLGEVGTPIGTDKIPALSFIQMLNYERLGKEEKPKFKGFSDYLEDAAKYAKEVKANHLKEAAEEKKKKAELEKEQKIKDAEFLKSLETKSKLASKKEEKIKPKSKSKPKI